MRNGASGAVRGSDLPMLLELGKHLDGRPQSLGGDSVREFLAESLLKIRDKQGRIVPLRMNGAQREFERSCGNRNIVLKARQLGMTTWVAARFFLRTITTPGTLSVQVAHDQQSAEEIFRMVHRFLENLPASMRRGALRTSRANVRQIVFPRLDSQYRVETAADPNAGRGLTIQNLHCSEVARWPHRAEETLAALTAAVPPAGEIVLESTPNGASGCFYQQWTKAEEKGYVRHFFPWWEEESYRSDAVNDAEWTDEERELAMAHGLDEKQIGFRRWIRANFGVRAAQEFAETPEECFLASGYCVFDADAAAVRLKELAEPLELREGGKLQIYLPAHQGGIREYIIGVDPAGGGAEGDYSCAQVLDLETGMQCAELHGHFRPEELARRVAALGREYNEAMLAVEANNHGHAVLSVLVEVEKYTRLYPEGGRPGWETTVLTRPRMIALIGAMLAKSPEAMNSRVLLEECRTFVRDAKGHEAAAQGEHDDAVMAMGVALAAREEILTRRAGETSQRRVAR